MDNFSEETYDELDTKYLDSEDIAPLDSEDIEKLENDKNLSSYLSTNNLVDYIRIITSTPNLTKEENRTYLEEYRKTCDNRVREKLIKGNLRLVLSIAYKYRRKLESYVLLDVIQDGTIGLIEAIEDFDLSYDNAFSSYATPKILSRIGRGVTDNDAMIRRPVAFTTARNKYYNVIRERKERGEPLPTKEELLDILGVSPVILKEITNDEKRNVSSLDKKAGSNDDSDTSIMNFIACEDKTLEKILENGEETELLVYLRTMLSPRDYYIIYYTVIFPNMTYEAIGKNLNLTRQRVKQLKDKALKKVRLFYNDNRNRKLNNVLSGKELLNINKFKVKPLLPKQITKYLYLRDMVSNEEKEFLKLYIFGRWKFNVSLYSRVLNIPKEKVLELKNSVDQKLAPLKNSRSYQAFHNSVLSLGDIYEIDLDMPLNDIKNDVSVTYSLWKDRSFAELEEILKSQGVTLSLKMEQMLRMFFNDYNVDKVSNKEVEERVNSIIFNLGAREDISAQALMNTLKKHNSLFTEQEKYILMYKFGIISKKELKNKFGDLNTRAGYDYLFEKLYRAYYNLKSYNTYDFNREKYLSIRDTCVELLPKESVDILDAFYRNPESVTSHEKLSDEFNISLEEMESNLRQSKGQAVSIYVGSSKYIKPNYNIYRDYIIDNDLEFTGQANLIIRAFLIDGLTYSEISTKFGVSTYKISNTITNALWQIDSYRFGITSKNPKYDFNVLRQLLDKGNFDLEEKEILECFIDTKDRKYVSVKFGKPLSYIKGLITRLYNLYKKDAVKDVTLTSAEIIKFIEAPEVENVLSLVEREIIAKIYGLHCSYNKEGKVYSTSEVTSILGINNNVLTQKKSSALKTMKASKLGLYRTTLGFIKRRELKIKLMDPRLPISAKERSILEEAYGINRAYKTMKEIASEYGENETSIQRRIYRAIIMIKRYELGEIPGKVSFELDVEPYFKYFSQSDRLVLIDIFKNNLSAQEIGEKHNLTLYQAQTLIYRLRVYLKDLQDGITKGIDFDYFYETVLKPDVPYHGNKKRSLEEFIYHYEDRMSYKDIAEKYYPDNNRGEKLVHKDVTRLLIAVMKRKSGIVMSPEFSYDKVHAYYLAHQDNLTINQERAYYNYFKNYEKGNAYTEKVPVRIALDLLSETNSYIHLNTCTKEQIKEFIMKYHSKLPLRMILYLAQTFDIDAKEIMSGQDIKHVLRFLSQYNTVSISQDDKKLNLK